jgi:hypothetical protein
LPSIVVSKLFLSGIRETVFEFVEFIVESELAAPPDEELLHDASNAKANTVAINERFFRFILYCFN